MAKIRLNPIVDAVRGQLGDLVFREVNGNTILSRKPVITGEPTLGQTAQRERFKDAVAYGRYAMADATNRAFYEGIADSRKVPVFSLTVADYLNAPEIESVGIADYSGQTGDPIQIVARDDFGVTNVQVTISNQQGEPLETGQAVELPAGTGRWTYVAANSIPSGMSVNIRVVATDRPGGTTVMTLSKTL